MKKLLALTVVGLLSGTAAVFAKGNHPMSGCGLAYVLFTNDNQSSIPLQVLGATTNGSFGNQTFGMTSGTLGCTTNGMIARSQAIGVFADVNLRQIERDASVGGGEYLTAFSQLLGVQDAKRAAFNQMVKENYSAIFPTAGTSSTEMIQNLNRKLAEHRDLLS